MSTLRQYAELGPLHRGRSLLWNSRPTSWCPNRGCGGGADPVERSGRCGLWSAGPRVTATPWWRNPANGVRTRDCCSVRCYVHLPEGVVRHSPGTALRSVVGRWADLDVIAHVGSTTTEPPPAAGTTEGAVENGGNDPLLADGDVDPVWAAEQAATGAFANSGQICVAVERIFVHRMPPPSSTRSSRRPNVPISKGGCTVPDAARAGHRRRRRCPTAGGGSPTVRPCTRYGAHRLRWGMRVWREETFGPVAPVCVVADFAEDSPAPATTTTVSPRLC